MCLSPLKAVHSVFEDLETGEVHSKIKITKYPDLFIRDNPTIIKCEPISLPCGHCIECLNQISNEWTFRLQAESIYHSKACFITLTYAETDGSLNPRDIELFLKRLRKSIAPVKIRYFLSGEYGSKGLRPHYHVIVFGWCPDDLYFWKKSKKGFINYRSPKVEKLWKFGFSTVEMLSSRTCKYTAKYMQKMTLNWETNHVYPFVRMSTKPGIGFQWFLDHKRCLETDTMYIGGIGRRVPRYFLKIAEREGVNLSELKENRINLAIKFERDSITLENLKNKYLDLFGAWCYNDSGGEK
ncbi:replication initiator protein [Capybara microvirus Cap3_SP_554]|nr:replication initiator protein [Capybara microvirus Cap3_SP_554]